MCIKSVKAEPRAHANLHGNYVTATINNGIITSQLNGEQHSFRNLFFRVSRKSPSRFSESAILLSIYKREMIRVSP